MIAQWRLFLLALRYFTRLPVPAGIIAAEALGEGHWDSAARFLPAVGAIVGLIAGGVYWLAAQLWPTSIAVVLSMLAAVLTTGGLHEAGLAALCAWLAGTPAGDLAPGRDGSRASAFGVLGLVFALLIKYNVLMALSAANLGFVLPENLALGLIMIAAHAASRALVVSVIPATEGPRTSVRATAPASRLSTGELSFALLTGFAPATVLGTPGLFGLAAAIIMRMALAEYNRRRLRERPGDFLGATQQLTELGFYLGGLAAWTYI
jgi:adenosylcobinamide-GDP ribazoletransferase